MANVKFVLDADEAKAVQGFLRVVDSQVKAETQFGKTNRKIKKQGKLTKDIKSHVGGMIAGFTTLGGVIGLTTGLMQKMSAASERAVESMQESRFATGKLFQVYKGKDIDIARQAVFNTRQETGMGAEQAGEMQFALASSNMDWRGRDMRKFFTQFYGTSKDPSSLIRGSHKLIEGFGIDEVGSVRQAVNKMLVASEKSDVDVDSLGIAMASVSKISGDAGASDEKALAMLSVFANTMGSPEEGATALKGLMNAISKRKIGGGNIDKALDILADPKNEELREKVEGNIRAKIGLNIALDRRGVIADLEKQLQVESAKPAGQGRSAQILAQTYGGETEASLDALALRNRGMAGQSRLIGEETGYGRGALKKQTVVDTVMADAMAAGDGKLKVAVREVMMSIAKGKKSSPETIEAWGQGYRGEAVDDFQQSGGIANLEMAGGQVIIDGFFKALNAFTQKFSPESAAPNALVE